MAEQDSNNIQQLVNAIQQIASSLQFIRTLPSGVTYIKPIISLGTTTDPKEDAILGEADGTLKVSGYGKAGSTLTSLKVETTGELDVVLHGKDSAGPNIDPIRTNDQQMVMIEQYEPWQRIVGVTLSNSEGLVYSFGSGAGSIYQIEIHLCNHGAGANTTRLGIDWGTAGSLGNGDYILYRYLQAGEDYRIGPFIVGSEDDIRGFATNANEVDVTIYAKAVGRT